MTHSNRAVTEAELHQELAEMEKRLRETMERIILPVREKADKTYNKLFGDGEIGFDERLRNVETKLDKLLKVFQSIGYVLGGYLLVEIAKILLEHL